MLEADHPYYRRDENGLQWLDFGGGQGPTGPAAISGNGKVLLTVRGVGTALIHDIESGDLIGKMTPKSPLEGTTWEGRKTEFKVFIESAALNRNGEKALLGLNDSTAGVFDVASGERLSVFAAEGSETKLEWGNVRGIAYSPDFSLIAVGFPHQRVGIWRADSLEPVVMLQRPDPLGRDLELDWTLQQTASSVSISTDNRFVFAGFPDMSVVVWEIETGEPALDAFRHCDAVVGVCITKEGLDWATSRGEVWRAEADHEPVMLLETGERWRDVAFHPGGEELIALRPERVVAKWAVNGRNTVLSTWPYEPSGFLPSGSAVFYGNAGELAIFPEAYNAMRVVGRTAQQSVRSDDPLKSVFLSPCETRLATVGRRLRVVELWEIPDAIRRHRFECTGLVSCVAFSRDGRLVAAGAMNGEIQIWNTQTGQQEWLLPTSYRPRSLAFGPDGSWLVCAEFGRIGFLAIESGSSDPIGDRELHYKDLDCNSLLVLADGAILVFRENSIESWDRLTHCNWVSDVPNLKQHYSLPGRRHSLDSCEERMAFGLEDGRLGILSLTDGQMLRTVSPDFPRPAHVSELMKDGVACVRAGYVMWRAPGGPYFHMPTGLYGSAVHLPRSSDGRLTLVNLDGEVGMVALDGTDGIVRRMPFRGYAKAFCIAEDRMLALNFDGELFIQDLAD